MTNTPWLAIVGPTASGKSAVALEIARREGDVELLSADAMQVYRGMDIGTAKATPDERAEVPHHLIDLADPSDPQSPAGQLVAEHRNLAWLAGRVPVPDVERFSSDQRRTFLLTGAALSTRTSA